MIDFSENTKKAFSSNLTQRKNSFYVLQTTSNAHEPFFLIYMTRLKCKHVV